LLTETDCCGRCETKFKESDRKYFIEIPLEQQVQQFFRIQEFYSGIHHPFERKKKIEANIEDFLDGTAYQNRADFFSQVGNLSMTWSTDGVQVFKSSKFCFWPVDIKFNSLPPHLRNDYLATIIFYFGEEKPKMNVILKVLVDTANKYYKEGYHVTTPDGRFMLTRGLLQCECLDLGAHAAVKNLDTHAGYFGCGCCYQQGVLVNTKSGISKASRTESQTTRSVQLADEEQEQSEDEGQAEGQEEEQGEEQEQVEELPSEAKKRKRAKDTMYFPYQAQPAPERTKAETEEYARQAVLTKKKVMGVHGPCVLSLVEDYDFILACYIDYMHGGCLGVGKSQLHIWTDPKHSSQPWSIRSLLPIIDAELQSIRPPTTVNRTPRSISDHLSFWKASEFRNWILFYSVPILRDRLPNPYFRHWCCFVLGLYILLLDSIPPFLLDVAHQLFVFFYSQQEILYGKQFCYINVHNLIHYVIRVYRFGPLWATNCFIFESLNGEFSSQVLGTHQIVQSVLYRFFMKKSLKSLSFNPSERVAELLKNLGLVYNSKHHEEGIFELLGSPTSRVLSRDEQTSLRIESNQIDIWLRCRRKEIVFTSESYLRLEKRSNSSVSFYQRTTRTVTLKFGTILFFYKTSHQDILAAVRIFKSTEEKDSLLLEKLYEYLRPIFPDSPQDQIVAVSLKDLIEPVFKIAASRYRHFLVQFPNRHEKNL